MDVRKKTALIYGAAMLIYTPEFYLKGCVCQRNFRCISLRIMLYVPPKISLKTANLLMCEGHYIRVQSIKNSPQTPINQGLAGC